ncbi:MAG: transporter substrate-binding domain-containing protein, partial [Desulfobacterales bacterium]|nr:transporter substrate-binding domain-containing protein [Desulfobacterales bacterium]
MKVVKSLCMIAVVVSALWSAPLFAKTVTIATGEWAPFTSEKMDGFGFASEMTTAVIKQMGMEVEYKFIPWKRCEHLVQKGKVWGAIPYVKSEKRALIYAFSDGLGVSRSVFFYYKDKLAGFDWKRYEDLKPYKFGGVLGYGTHENLQKQGLNVEFAQDDKGSFKKLKHGRIDLFSINELVGWELIKALFPDEVDNFNTLPTAENESGLCVI